MTVNQLDALVWDCLRKNASGLKIQSGQPPMVRTASDWQPAAYGQLDQPVVDALIDSVTSVTGRQELTLAGKAEFVFWFGEAARIHTMVARCAENAALEFQLS